MGADVAETPGEASGAAATSARACAESKHATPIADTPVIRVSLRRTASRMAEPQCTDCAEPESVRSSAGDCASCCGCAWLPPAIVARYTAQNLRQEPGISQLLRRRARCLGRAAADVRAKVDVRAKAVGRARWLCRPRRWIALVFCLVGLQSGCLPPGFTLQEAGPIPLDPAVSVVTVQEDYAIAGRDRPQLLRQMRERGPRDSGGRHHAYTRWRLRWTHDPQPVGSNAPLASGCRPGQPQITLFLLTVAPRWVDVEQAAPSLRSTWARFLEATQQHEEGHRNLCMRAAQSLLDRLRSLSPAEDCSRLQQQAQQVAAQVLDDLLARQRAYDRLTDHGMRQGTDLLQRDVVAE